MLLRKAKVNNVYFTTILIFSNNKICWLDVSVDEALGMHIIDAVKHLNK